MLFPLLPGPRVLLTVAQGIGPLALELALGKFSHVLVSVGKGHRPLTLAFIVLPGSRVASAVFIRVDPLSLPLPVDGFPNIDIPIGISQRLGNHCWRVGSQHDRHRPEYTQRERSYQRDHKRPVVSRHILLLCVLCTKFLLYTYPLWIP